MPSSQTPETLRDLVQSQGVAASGFTAFLGIDVARCWDGTCELSLVVRRDLTQSLDTLHGGVLAGLADIVCGFAAFSACGPVVTANIVTHMLGPARIGDIVRAVASVKSMGRRQVVVTADFHVVDDEGDRLILTATASLVRVGASSR